MNYFVNCNNGSLNPYTVPLNATKINHFFRRIGFSCNIDTTNSYINSAANDMVDTIINEALNMPLPPAPTWATWNNTNYPEDGDARRELRRAHINEWKLAYSKSLLTNNLRDRLSFFWSNHFVTQLGVYNCPSYLYGYTTLLQTYALGNFKEFTRAIGIDNAMLFYLDGAYNSKNRPNENYARELYELFTLGEGNNYTEADVQDTSRAFTGYTLRGDIGCNGTLFDATDFDNGSKTIFGQTGNFGYDEVIEILFTERSAEIAYFICKKLYEFFVHPDSLATEAEIIINGLAADFEGNWEIAPILSRLFKSEHFFDDTAVGVIIKSPFDLNLNIFNELNTSPTDELLTELVGYNMPILGQEIFHPVEVEGWQRDRSWINTNFMIGRWLTSEYVIAQMYNGNDPDGVFINFGIAAAGAQVGTANPDIIAKAIIDKLLPNGLLTDEDYQGAYDVFRRDDLSAYYEDTGDGSWTMVGYNSHDQIYKLIQYIARQPEFQLK